MEKIKNICCDLGRAFTIGLLSGGAAAAVLLLGGFLFGGFTFRAALEAAKDGLLLIACSQFSAFPGCCGRQRRIIFCIGCENSFYK